MFRSLLRRRQWSMALSAHVLIVLLLQLQIVAASAQEIVNVYNWTDYIGSSTIPNFSKETGISVKYDLYDSNEVLQAKMSVGRSGYDVVVPTAEPFFARQLKSGLFYPLDRTKIPNWKYLDPELMRLAEDYDPGNRFGVIYQWGTNGIGYDRNKILARLPNAPLNSWKLIFDPEVVKNFKDCGVVYTNSPSEIFPMVLFYLGYNPNSQSEDELKVASDHLLRLRPYIRQFRSTIIDDLAGGEACLVTGFSGDILQAKARAGTAGGTDIRYLVPDEGTMLWFDMLAIPKDAPNIDNAHKFINFVLRPDIMADITHTIRFANAIPESLPLVDQVVRDDPSVFPPEELRKRLFTVKPSSAAYERSRTRAWTRVTSGR